MSSSAGRTVVGVISCALVAILSSTLFAVQAPNVAQGVYSDAQAKRGQSTYQAKCASCHGGTLAGGNGPALAGADFLSVWGTGSLFELASKIRNTMPQTEPGTLTPEQTADVVAFVLQSNKLPAGRAELRDDEASLKQIVWPARNGPQARPATAATQGPSFPPVGNLAQVMRGILFPSSNIIFTVQTVDPGAKPAPGANAGKSETGFNWMLWGADIYKGWDLVDYAAVSLAESAPLMLTPGRRCENGRPVPVNDPEWIKFTQELADVGKAAYKASQSRNQEAVSDISNDVADACLHCHQVYRDRRARDSNAGDLANKAGRCVK
jgi:mono/diheme cytochrome c family protein